MQGRLTPLAASAASLLLAAATAQAHHAFSAEFDAARPVELRGVVTRMEWINPHARMFFEVETEDGEIQVWTAWYSSSNNLYRRGWRDGDLPVGAMVTVSGFPARDGSFQLYGGDTLLPDGRTLFGGNAPGQR